jgi:hypothetical protein
MLSASRDDDVDDNARKQPAAVTTVDVARREDEQATSMLLQTVLIGVLQPPVKNIRYHWLEFVEAVLPYLGDGAFDDDAVARM